LLYFLSSNAIPVGAILRKFNCFFDQNTCYGVYLSVARNYKMAALKFNMTNHEFNTIPVADGSQMDAYISFPEGTGPYPAIILFQEAYGVNQHIRNVAERFCKEGYAVIAPDLFHRTVRRLEISYTDFSAAMPHFQAVTKEGLTADLEAAYNWLIQLPVIKKEKVGSVGFCLGGRVSFLANAVLPLSAAVSYYGGSLEQLAGEAPGLHGAHLFYWGGQDKHITQDKIDTTVNAVKAAGKEYTSVIISYADHGFNCDERASYNPLAAKEAWAHTVAFLGNRLK
jgi:carboxymethylenebutenolidase